MTGHLGSGNGIADLILHGIAFSAFDLQRRAVVAAVANRQLWSILFVVRDVFLITAAQRCNYAWVERRQHALEFLSTSSNDLFDGICTCSTKIICEERVCEVA